MASLLSRRYADSSDVTRMIDFLRSVRPPERATDYPGIVDLPELLSIPQNQATLRLWLADSDRLLAFAFVDAFHTLRFELDWPRVTPELEAAIIAWGADCIRQMPNGAGSLDRLFASCHEADSLRHDFLTRHGFTLCADHIVHMSRVLAAPIPSVELVAGFRMRSVAGEREAAAVAALHRAAFGTPHMTTERRLSIMRSPHYDPDLDLVVVAADGTLAAYGMGGVSAAENRLTGQQIGYADLFATHPAYRGYGLAQALMSRILQRLRERSCASARLSTASDNRSMQRVAGKLRFAVSGKTLRLQRAIVPE